MPKEIYKPVYIVVSDSLPVIYGKGGTLAEAFAAFRLIRKKRGGFNDYIIYRGRETKNKKVTVNDLGYLETPAGCLIKYHASGHDFD